MRDLLAPYGIEAVSAGELKLPEPEETGNDLRRKCAHQGGGRVATQSACRHSPTIPVSAVDALGGAARHSFGALGRTKQRFRRRDERDSSGYCSSKQDQRRPRLLRLLRYASPGRTVTSRNSRRASRARWSFRRVATQGFGYDPIFLPDGHDAHLRRNERRGETRPAAARQGLVASRARIREIGRCLLALRQTLQRGRSLQF